MSYVIRNCPAIFYYRKTDEAKCWQKWEHFDDSCKNCNDCIIKQVIEKCKKHNNTYPVWEILNMFDIEEIRE